MKALVSLLLLASLISACSSASESAALTLVGPTAAEELIAANPDLVVLDVRTPPEVAQGTIGDPVVIDYQAPGFEDGVAELARDVPYLVYCRSGNRSAGATAIMRDLGFEQIYELDGGIVAWAESGRELTTG